MQLSKQGILPHTRQMFTTSGYLPSNGQTRRQKRVRNLRRINGERIQNLLLQSHSIVPQQSIKEFNRN